jgi:hypothetical protein
MRRRQLDLGGVLLVAVVAVWWLWPDPPGVTKGNYERISQGMTLEQVRELLGSPGEESADPPPDGLHGERVVVWPDPYAWIWVGFNQCRVVSKRFMRNTF